MIYGVRYDGILWFVTKEGTPLLSCKSQSDANRMCEKLEGQEIFYLTPAE
jgi:hypothetical protein